MWTKLAHIVLKYRLLLIAILGVITLFMAYHAQDVEYSYSLTTAVPKNDPDMQYFTRFKSEFGEDGNMLAIGLYDSSLYTVDNFRRFKYLSEELQRIKGVNRIMSLPLLEVLTKDPARRQFKLEKVFQSMPEDQQMLDSMLRFTSSLKFYSDRLVNPATGATFVLITVDSKVLNSKERDLVIEDIVHAAEAFSVHSGIDLYYVGLPYIRSEVNGKIKRELQGFLALSLVVTAVILLSLFRSWDAVVFPIIVIFVIVIWSLGTIDLLGYRITMLTGLLPPLIVVIGIPNSIYLLNKYHQEIEKHGNKIRALSHVIRKIGLVALITNFTTAIGFIVLVTTDIVVLREFGVVAGINIMATFLVSIILIPAVFSYLPAPNGKQLRHLRFRALDFILTNVDLLVHRHKYAVFMVTGVVVLVSIVGLMRLRSVSYMVDDVPADSQVKKDLDYFEDNFGGIMPMEIVLDTKKKRGVMQLDFLRKVDTLEQHLASHADISKPVSVVGMLKAARQAFYNQNPAFYDLPNRHDKAFIFRYFNSDPATDNMLRAFMDEDQSKMRISMNVADIGSKKLDDLLRHTVDSKIDVLFDRSETDIRTTGTTLLFVKSNKYLVQNLRFSLLLAFLIIAIIMGILFRNAKMILISLIPNIIPLLVTAGIMGFLDIPLRPSTALIFSVVFGISVDDSIHFLAK
jgi:predicted RND superfamily exporter protein